MIRFEHPWALLALLALPALAWWRRRRPATRPAALLWGTTAGLAAPGAMAALLALVRALPWVALALALVAAGRPQQGLEQSEIESKGVDIVLTIDISPSMRAQDMGGGDRLSLAKATAREFVRNRPHDRIGVVGFGGTAFTQCPLTLDHDTLLELLDQLDFGLTEDGTAIGMGLATAVQRLRDSRSPSKVVVLLTDGENNRGAIDPLTAADLARAMGVKVYTVLVGQPTVAPVEVDDPVYGRTTVMQAVTVDDKPLIEIARRTGGRFFRAGDAATLSGIYGAIDRLERAPIRSLVYRDYRDLGPGLLGIAAALLALGALSGASWAFRAP
ncbi:MAG TPA: VWA domain-containing protein [Candidatus Eisenbacteria bacterium]|nr:VWA domain-containing protein [Candidatus Eisenbacteria bacterium]